MTGGAGRDRFVFEMDSAFNDIDVITDFTILEDVLDVSDLLTVYDPLTDALADFVSVTRESGQSFVNVDRDGTGTMYDMEKIAHLDGYSYITSADQLHNWGQLIV